MLHKIVNLSSIWIVAIFFNLNLYWAYFFVFLGLLVVVQIATRMLISCFSGKFNPSQIGLLHKAMCWVLIFAINILCSVLVGILPFSLGVNYALAILLTIIITSLLGVNVIS